MVWWEKQPLWELEKTMMVQKTEGRRRRKTADKMVGWHHQINGHEFEQLQETVKDKEVCCSPWGLRVRQDLATEQHHILYPRTF